MYDWVVAVREPWRMAIADVEFIVRLVVALILVWAGFRKIADLRSFALAIADYRLIPTGATYPTAVGIVVLELLIGVALVVGVYPAVSAIASATLLGAFS